MIPLRSPNQVMRLKRLGAAHQTRLSFMRVLLRGLRRGGWQCDRPVWSIDAQGVGHAVYRVRGQGQAYSLVAFAHELPDELRSDRVIATAWDATFALVDGEAKPDDIARLAGNVPLQEAGRISDRELVLSRANRSARLWTHVVERLSEGLQPDACQLEDVGYLMRTTAVYGSGKFGAADHTVFAGRPLLDGPFRAEMLTVWLIRAFVVDLVEHIARARGGARAARLNPDLKRRLGIGNSTGLGMAPFLVHHPGLLNAWIMARETAIARVRSRPSSTACERTCFRQMLDRTTEMIAGWRCDDRFQAQKLDRLRQDLSRLADHVDRNVLDQPTPWDQLWLWAEVNLSAEGQELTLSLMLEPFGEEVDDLAETMCADEVTAFCIDGGMSVAGLAEALSQHYGWALSADYSVPEACTHFWYVSEAKLEPRLGDRHKDAGSEREQPLDVARAAAALDRCLAEVPTDLSVAAFLRRYPEHRWIARRIQMSRTSPYSEIRDNLIGSDLLPVDMLRCKLSFFGATRFDPRSDRWVRITMYQNAPFPDELHIVPEDDWILPKLAGAAA
ncbi:MAG: hypothetical protein AAGF59_13450 [Pseudomonadota bacterium]